MTPRRRRPLAPSARAPHLGRVRAWRPPTWSAGLSGALAGLGCGLALFAQAPVVDGVAGARDTPSLALAVARDAPALAPVASVIEPAAGSGRALATERAAGPP